MASINPDAPQTHLLNISQDCLTYADQTHMLDVLYASPPQTLLFEGGAENARLALALYWAMTINCGKKENDEQNIRVQPPCMQCPDCRQLMALESHDLLLFDGRIGNKQDEDEPGIFRALRMENMRGLKIALGSAPGHLRKRVVIITGMTMLREEALNSLLKILEEPTPYTLFCLLVGQREQILPTLVSRCFCLTLPWKTEISPETMAMAHELGRFLNSGKGFLNGIAAKGAIDSPGAENLLLACRQALASACKRQWQGNEQDLKNELALFFGKLAKDPHKLILVQNWINEASEMLALGVSPGRCLEGFATRLHVLALKN